MDGLDRIIQTLPPWRWGQEMVQTTADYILDLIEELKKGFTVKAFLRRQGRLDRDR